MNEQSQCAWCGLPIRGSEDWIRSVG